MIFLTIGTGLGGGAILNGELLSSDISLFEAGHINIDLTADNADAAREAALRPTQV